MVLFIFLKMVLECDLLLGGILKNCLGEMVFYIRGGRGVFCER